MDVLEHPLTIIQQRIYTIRDCRVMMDFDLAELYGVETRILNQAVKRNIERFPHDFMFQLSKKELIEYLNFQNAFFDDSQDAENNEFTNQRSQIATFDTQNADNQNNQRSQIVMINRIRYLPYVFTEQGIAMLSSVLKSKRAIKINIAIMRVFVEMRKFFMSHQELQIKIAEIAQQVGEHDQYIRTLYDYLKSFDEEQKRREEWEKRRPIGF